MEYIDDLGRTVIIVFDVNRPSALYIPRKSNNFKFIFITSNPLCELG